MTNRLFAVTSQSFFFILYPFVVFSNLFRPFSRINIVLLSRCLFFAMPRASVPPGLTFFSPVPHQHEIPLLKQYGLPSPRYSGVAQYGLFPDSCLKSLRPFSLSPSWPPYRFTNSSATSPFSSLESPCRFFPACLFVRSLLSLFEESIFPL